MMTTRMTDEHEIKNAGHKLFKIIQFQNFNMISSLRSTYIALKIQTGAAATVVGVELDDSARSS